MDNERRNKFIQASRSLHAKERKMSGARIIALENAGREFRLEIEVCTNLM